MIYICALLLAAPLAAQGQKENPLENTKTLFNSLTESDPAKREAAFDYVKNKRPEDLIPYLKKAILAKKGFFFAPDYSNRTVHINALKLYPFTESLKWWIEILQETDSSMMKIEIMNYITESGHRSIVMPIVEELRNNFFIVRQEAARILRGKSNDRVYPVILSMMNDPNPAVRIYAIDAMNYLYDSRFNNELINMIYDSDAGVRIRVIKSI
ncbi:MAG: HEAT repeat domain-containing protein, partial [Spirochaetia bacterium]|nr:HEAT repeat domain-containing protein [Spirochaetia bacterium]